jgi:thiamine-phosphate pyrophosphorylase
MPGVRSSGADRPAARIYLITPPSPDLADFADMLARLLDGGRVACVRLALAAASEDAVARVADALRPICHDRDVPLVLADHFRLVPRLGLDGVHLSNGARQVRVARKLLGADAIVGAFARASRHEGMSAAEAGADYVGFGPLTATALGDGSVAEPELFAWWAEMIEVPVVAEGGVTPDMAGALAETTDFLALGDEVWSAAGGPEAALRDIAARLA